MNRNRARGAVAAFAVLAGLCALGTPPASSRVAQAPIQSAAATAPPPYLVTLVARSCPTYTSIRANKARNNIMESLQNLGPDTNYNSGEVVNPVKEDAAPQSACSPLVGWKFQWGDGINGRTPGTNLSRVANPGPVSTTGASVPELDRNGNPTGNTIAGAVTYELTQAQVNLAGQGRLWIQGGTATDPLGTASFGTRYSFGALRCATDNVNGDNVEFVSYPQRTGHVFCYAYYVDNGPPPATVVIRKAVTADSPRGVPFDFGGNVSYEPGGVFTLTPTVADGIDSLTFVRAAGEPWFVTEDVPAGWSGSVSCTTPGASTWSSSGSPTGTVRLDFTLAAGDTLTCTFTDDWSPPATNGVTMFKNTIGNTGTFPIDAYGTGTLTPSLYTWSATTTAEEEITQATGPTSNTFLPLSAATFDFVETLPAPTGAGSWAVTDVACVAGGTTTAYTPTLAAANRWKISVPVNSSGTGPGTACVWENTYTPAPASLSIRSRTNDFAGGVSTYFTSPTASLEDPSTDKYRYVDNTAADTFVNSSPQGPDDDLSAVTPESWTIIADPPVASAERAWVLQSIECEGSTGTTIDLPSAQAVVTLPPGGSVNCDFVWVPQAVVTLGVVKSIVGDGPRDSNGTIELVCDNEAETSMTFGPSATGTITGPDEATTFTSTECTVTETATGAAAGTTVQTSYEVIRTVGSGSTTIASGNAPVTFAVDAVADAGATFTASVKNTYTAAATTTTVPPTTAAPSTTVAPTTTTPPGGTGGTGATQGGAQAGEDLAYTGPGINVAGLVLEALALMALGWLMVVARPRRPRRARLADRPVRTIPR